VSDINSDLIAQEVDDEVRRERMNLLWKAYGKYLIAAAIGVVLVVAGREIYNWRVTTTETANSVAFTAALEEAAVEEADVASIWRSALPDLGAGYGALARLQLADAELKAGRTDMALEALDELAADTAADKYLRDLAALKAGMLVAGTVGDLDAAKGRLSTLAVKGESAWYYSAQEQLALIDLQQANLDAALLKFTLLADDAETPQSISGRAAQFREFIESQNRAAAMSAPSDATTPEASPPAGEETEDSATSEGNGS